MSKLRITSDLMDIESLIEKINQREYLIIAADEKILQQLPSGNWIAGTIPYFMGHEGGEVSQEKAFVNTLEGLDLSNPPRIMPYDANSIKNIAQDALDNGFTITILPAGSDVHAEYAENAPSYNNMFFSPLIGWIAGNHLEQADAKPHVGFGPVNMLMADKAIAMHVSLPENQFANINIVNLFEQGNGPSISFETTGFSTSDCLIDGKPEKFSEYLQNNNIDTRLPLVADYNGVNINVSIKELLNDSVEFYAPIFQNVKYQFADPITDYVTDLDKAIASHQLPETSFSFNCILNFLYAELENKKTAKLTGPFTFGEIAYQLLNQTLVYLSIESN